VWLLLLLVHRGWIMKRHDARQGVSGNTVYQIALLTAF